MVTSSCGGFDWFGEAGQETECGMLPVKWPYCAIDDIALLWMGQEV